MDTTENQDSLKDVRELTSSYVSKYGDDYKNYVFLSWMRAGRPSSRSLRNLLKADDKGHLPSAEIINRWIKDEFSELGDQIDAQVKKELEERLLKEKIEMLERHADVGKYMQNTALLWFKGHEEEISSNTALRLLVEGINIERGSVGIPQALTKMIDKTDEDLLDEVKAILTSSAVSIESIEDDS